MPIPLPAHWLRRVFLASQLYDALIALCALGAGIAGVLKLRADGQPGLAVFVGICLGLVFAFSLLRARVTFYTQSARESLHELKGCLMTLHALLIEADSADEQSAGLRLTVHVACRGDKQLKQVLDYVGDGRGGKTVGRTFPVQSGIAGYVYRAKEAYHAQRENTDYEAYVQELVTFWSFSEADARKVNPATMSWMSVPLTNSGKIEGILYLDSRQPDFFDEDRQDLILRATVGVARYVGERYSG